MQTHSISRSLSRSASLVHPKNNFASRKKCAPKIVGRKLIPIGEPLAKKGEFWNRDREKEKRNILARAEILFWERLKSLFPSRSPFHPFSIPFQGLFSVALSRSEKSLRRSNISGERRAAKTSERNEPKTSNGRFSERTPLAGRKR